ncbi:hypothetical protein SprV_0200562000 [Sparganum proliferum]
MAVHSIQERKRPPKEAWTSSPNSDAEKMMVMRPAAPDMDYGGRILINEAQIPTVDKSPYLGGKISRNVRMDDEVAHRISKASQELANRRPQSAINIDPTSAPKSRCAEQES